MSRRGKELTDYLCLSSALVGDMDISVFSKYLSEMKRVYPTVEGRIRVQNSVLSATANHCLVLVLLGLLSSIF